MDKTASLRTDLLPRRLGSEEHKQAFWRMLLDTHNPYEPAIMESPKLEGSPRRLALFPWGPEPQCLAPARMVRSGGSQR
jgi:hypothetical protein